MTPTRPAVKKAVLKSSDAMRCDAMRCNAMPLFYVVKHKRDLNRTSDQDQSRSDHRSQSPDLNQKYCCCRMLRASCWCSPSKPHTE